ncbi:hypothetical protein JTB14_004533 [Gonioctena quinquepunctata]|nr:hypothetical protein JTB14_004533 [Gonioctena quinquepunctata]
MQSNINSDDNGIEKETIDDMQGTMNVEPATPISVSSENFEGLSTGTLSHYAEPRTGLKNRVRKRKNQVDALIAIEEQKLELIRTTTERKPIKRMIIRQYFKVYCHLGRAFKICLRDMIMTIMK